MYDNNTDDPSPTVLLDHWNAELRTTLLPIIFILFVYLIFGILGNIIVIYIYKFRFREYNEERYFIPILAIVDLFASVVCPTGEIIAYFNPVKYINVGVCKFFQTMEHFASGYSAIFLTVVAVNRYRTLCCPFKPRFTIKTKRLILISTFVSMICLVIPSVITNGIKKVEHSSLNVTGYRCTTVKVRGSSTFPLAYNLLLMTACVGNLLVLCVLYIRIINAILKQAKRRCSQMISSIAVVPSSSISQTDKTRQNTRNSKIFDVVNRLTLMFCTVTAIYVICFIPTLIVMIWISLDNDWLAKSHSQIVGTRFVRNLVMINNIVNPVIYGIFDKTFRDEIMKIVKVVK